MSFSGQDTGKHRPENLRILTLSTQCEQNGLVGLSTCCHKKLINSSTKLLRLYHEGFFVWHSLHSIEILKS